MSDLPATEPAGGADHRGTTTRRRGPRRTIDLRRGTLEDVNALIAMHRRCSAESVYRRYHFPTPSLSPRTVRTITRPQDGWSLLATSEDVVVGVAVVAMNGAGEAEAGILVEDAWQQRGVGSRLLRACARQAADAGGTTLVCVMQNDNTAMLATIHGVGLTAHIAIVDDRREARMPIDHLATDAQRRENKLTISDVTAPLVTLLSQRHDLRDVSGPADLIDRAVRDSA